jgi:hypothetical protein
MDAAKLEAQEDIALATTSNQAQFTQFTGEKSPDVRRGPLIR